MEKKAVKRLYGGLILLVVLMFGFGYALVPLYNVLCKQLGVNGKTGGQENYTASAETIDKHREITLEFLATTNGALPWDFYPNTVRLKFHPGEFERVSFHAKNKGNSAITVQAIPSVSPGLAAKYLKKTECFCFTQQTLQSGEAIDMPILFHIDKALPASIHTITLSYTLFDVTGRHLKSSQAPGKIR